MPASYCVQYAASNRSTCKTCKTKIDAAALRIGTITPGPGDYDITSWRHLACNKQPKGLVEAELAGFRATRLGNRHRAERLIEDQDPRGRRLYWIGPAGGEVDAGPGTDFHAVAQGFVSITPLQIDLTRHASLEPLTGWLDGL